jgi:hypothetical protein
MDLWETNIITIKITISGTTILQLQMRTQGGSGHGKESVVKQDSRYNNGLNKPSNCPLKISTGFMPITSTFA